MKAYRKQIPGRNKELCEDGCYDRIFADAQGRENGIFIVGDGLSGFQGDRASNRAVNGLGQYLEEKWFAPEEQLRSEKLLTPEGQLDISLAIKEKLSEIDKAFRGVYKTTLDCVVVRENRAYITHVGDSRIYTVSSQGIIQLITEDEKPPVAGAGPSNSVGALKKVNQPEPLDISQIRYFFLATDGLWSRVTEEQIATLLRTCQGEEAPFLLERLARLVYQPKEKLQGLPKETLYNILRGQGGVLPDEKNEVVDLIFSLYGRDSRVNEAVDRELKFDDTTMILVDIEDTVSKSIAVQGMRETYELRIQELQEETKENAVAAAQGKALREAVDRVEKEKENLGQRLEKAGSDYAKNLAQVQGDLSAAQEREIKERERSTEATRGLNALQGKYDEERAGWIKDKGNLEGRLQREQAETWRLNTELQLANSQYREKSGEWTAEKARLEEQRKAADAAKQGADKKYDELAKKEQRWINEQEELGRLRLEVPDIRRSKSRLEIQVNEAKATLTKREDEYQKDKAEWGKDKEKLNEEKAEVVAERNMIRTEYDADKEEWRTKEASLEQKATQYEQERNDAVARQHELIMQNSGLVAKLSKLQEDHFKLQEGNSKLQGDYASMAKQFADQKVAWEEKEPKYQREIARLKAEQGVTPQDNQQSKSIGNELTRLDSVAEAYKPNGKPQEAAVSLPTSTPSKTSDQKKWYSRLGSFLSRR